MAEAVGWRSSCLAFALLICLVGLPLMWRGARSLEAAVDEAETQPAEGEGGQRAVSFLRRPAFWLLAIAFALLGLNHSAILNHFLPMLAERGIPDGMRSEEHTSELQPLMRISYAVFCLKKKK